MALPRFSGSGNLRPAGSAHLGFLFGLAFVNTTLWGIPARVIHGNTLSGEYWAAWSNLHYLAPWLPYLMRPMAPEAMAQGQPPAPMEVERIQVALGQQEFAL